MGNTDNREASVMKRRSDDNGSVTSEPNSARRASARLPIPAIITAHYSTKKALLGLIMCALAALQAGCGGGGSNPAPAPATIAETGAQAADEEAVALKGVVYGPAELSGEPRMGARSAINATGRDLPILGATVIPCEVDENGELVPIQGLSAETAADGSFSLVVPARRNIVLAASREFTVNGQTRVFSVKTVVLFSDEDKARREKSGVALDASTTLVVEGMRGIVLEARARGNGAIRGADISPEALEALLSHMQAALTMDQTQPAPVVDLLDVTTGQQQQVNDEFKQIVHNTPGGGQVQDTVENAIEISIPAPAPPAEPAPVQPPVMACTASTQVSGGMTAQGHGHGFDHTVRGFINYWKQNTDKNWRKRCRSGRGTHCVRVHVVGIQGSGGPLQDATVTFTADGYSQTQTTDAKGNAYFSNVPYGAQRSVTAVKSGYKMIRTSRNIKKARAVWNVVVMMGYDEAAPACCADTDCDDGDADTADSCMNPGQATAVCEHTPQGTECSTDADCGGGYCVNGGTAAAVCVSCTADTHCDDGDAATVDTCSAAGTETAVCVYTPALCSTNADCDDQDAYTADTCNNAGAASAACSYTAVACITDSECSDGNDLTLDACSSPGTASAACTHTAIACATDANCNDGNAYTQDVCMNPGTTASSCSHLTVACISNADCEDGYKSTIDTCVNPGTAAASCEQTIIACFSAGDCNDGNPYTLDSCVNAGAANASCSHTPIACLTNADCNDGNSGTIDTCENPGTTTSVCTYKADDGWITIPGGAFPRGCTAAEPSCMTDAQPQRQIYLNEYRIMKNSVTNAQYQQCVAAGACSAPLSSSSYSRPSYYGNPAYANYPVIYVSWSNAEAYCNFSGGRLPTEAEWEKAARGTTARTYPWGESAPACTLANAFIGAALCVGDTSPAGSLTAGASPYGAMDMAGNTLEWTRDWYDGAYYAASPDSNPTGPASGTYKVIRGGSWHHNTLYLRATYRSVKFPNSASNDISFRCVK